MDYETGRQILMQYGYRETQKSESENRRVIEIAAKFVHTKDDINCRIRYRLISGEPEYELIEWR